MKRRLVAGIDPGRNGGVSVIAQGSDRPYPFSVVARSKLQYTALGMPDVLWLADYLNFASPEKVYLEKAHAMRGQGVRSIFTYGRDYGMLIAACQMVGVSVVQVPPASWQRLVPNWHLPAGEGPKERSLKAAKSLFGVRDEDLLATDRSVKPHEGIVDSLMIALGGWLLEEGLDDVYAHVS